MLSFKMMSTALAVFFVSSVSHAYEIYRIQKFSCAGGKTMGIVVAHQVGFVPEKAPKWYPKYYCDSNSLEDRAPVDEPVNPPASQFKNCIDDSAKWVQDCYDKEFAPKCLNGKFLSKACAPQKPAAKDVKKDSAPVDEGAGTSR